jgi:hypothetical protein
MVLLFFLPSKTNSAEGILSYLLIDRLDTIFINSIYLFPDFARLRNKSEVLLFLTTIFICAI